MTAPIPVKEIDAAQMMYSSGKYTLMEVADACGLNYWTMRRYFKKRGVEVNTAVAINTSARKRSITEQLICGCGEPADSRRSICTACGAARARWRTIARQYGLTPEMYRRLLDEQGGCCAICSAKPDYPLRVDHDHETGYVRGLLCNGCNVALGRFGDSVEGLRKALRYVQKVRDTDGV